MPKVTIASIYPLERIEERPKYRGLPYVLPAAPKGSVSYLGVEDEIQQVRVPLTESTTIPQTVYARDIANDLLRCWTTNGRFMNPQCHPGIWICAGDVATPEEVQSAMEVQTAYFHQEVDWADGMHRDKKTQGINPGARMAATWLGLEKEWLHPTAVATCQFCGKPIPKNVPVCHQCGNVVNAVLFAELKRRGEAEVAEAMKNAQSPLAPPPLTANFPKHPARP
mgnify:CR=1 FL=1